MTVGQFSPHFVETIPEAMDAGVLYVSMSLASAIHLCACGCGREVITPLSPTDWKLCFDGEDVTLEPSIGNWSFPCRSHYWIRGGKVRWAGPWSTKEIADERAYDRKRKIDYYDRQDIMQEEIAPEVLVPRVEGEDEELPPSWLRRVWSRFTCSE